MIMRLACVILGAMALSACGLTPLYTASTPSQAQQAEYAQGLYAVEIAPIQGKAGWLMRNALNEQFHPSTRMNVAPKYRLDVALDEKLDSLGALADDTVSRERRTLRARYQLVDLANGEIVLDRSLSGDAGIDVVSSEYATIAAEDRALENITLDMARRMSTQIVLALSGET